MLCDDPVGYFLDRPLPEEGAMPVGYACLIKEYHLKVPLPSQFCFISRRHQRYETQQWAAFTPRHLPEDSIQGHLTFALRYEGVDLAILQALFDKVNPEIIARWIRSERTGSYSRRIWFLYEWITGNVLDEPDVTTGNYVDALPSKLQFGLKNPIPSRRHRVNNNFPGTLIFCPLIRRTRELEGLMETTERCLEAIREMGKDSKQMHKLSRRMALMDAHASLSLDKLSFNSEYVHKWANVLTQDNKPALSLEELTRLQRLFIPDQRFVQPGLRQTDSFVGDDDPITQASVPEQIYAKASDLPELVAGWLDAWDIMKEKGYNPILTAVSLAFGYGFMAPLADGNARIQRYLIHYVLEQCRFLPAELVFSMSAIIFSRLEAYQEVIRMYAQPRLELISWDCASDGQFQVTNGTKGLFSYYDATLQAEFLYSCLKELLVEVLPKEKSSLIRYDHFKGVLKAKFDMPNELLDAFIRTLHQENGIISKQAFRKEFQMLTDKECRQVEEIYREVFVSH